MILNLFLLISINKIFGTSHLKRKSNKITMLKIKNKLETFRLLKFSQNQVND